MSSSDRSDSTVHLLARARNGDRTALHALIERATPQVRRWARGRLPRHARHDANTEDVVQDAVLRTIKNAKRLRERTVGGVQAYLRQSVVNRIRDLIRGTNRHGLVSALDEDLSDDAPSPLELALKGERHERFVEALGHLKPADRQLLIWRLELGYSVEQIAARLGKSKAAAGMSVTRATARLAKELSLDVATE